MKRPAKVKRWGIARRALNGRWYLIAATYDTKADAAFDLDPWEDKDNERLVPVYIAVDAAWWERSGPK